MFRLAVVGLMLLAGGCSTLGFYTQAIRGQVTLLMHREPVDKILASPSTDATLRHKLEVTQAARRFARDQLGLSVGASYSTYVDLGRPYVVWNVFAAPEFSLSPRHFCYPIAGCVSYRGFFHEADARAFAKRLASSGDDVYMGGVAAYSTLGWFNDPVLNTFLDRSDAGLAALLFHELAHKTVYLKGDTRFNESYATTVERVGLKRWLASRDALPEYAAYMAKQARENQVIALIEHTNSKLKAIYASGEGEAKMRAEKQAAIAALRADYARLRAGWGDDHDEFAWWMKTDINNAKLATIATYNDWVPAFKALLAQQQGDMPAFIEAVRKLAKEDPATREKTLAALAARPVSTAAGAPAVSSQ